MYATQPGVSTVERPRCSVDAIRPLLNIPSDLKLQWTHEILHSGLGFSLGSTYHVRQFHFGFIDDHRRVWTLPRRNLDRVNMAFHDLSADLKSVRDNTTNKNLARTVASRVTMMVGRILSPKPSRSPTPASSQSTTYGTTPTIIVLNLICR